MVFFRKLSLTGRAVRSCSLPASRDLDIDKSVCYNVDI